MRGILFASTALASFVLFNGNALSAECVTSSNGSVWLGYPGSANQSSCEVSSIAPTMTLGQWGQAIYLYSGGSPKTITVTGDLTSSISQGTGIGVFGEPSTPGYLDARGRTINLTMSQNPGMPQTGAGVSHGSKIDIGTFNVTMNNLAGVQWYQTIEHYGVLAGSSINAAENAATNGVYSHATFDNLNINMNSQGYSLINGIRAIQGAANDSGFGSSGYVTVNDLLTINLNAQGKTTGLFGGGCMG